MNSLLTSFALWLHGQHAKAYSYYKVLKSSVSTVTALTWQERDFYLSLRPGLQGENLVIYDIGAANGLLSGCLAKLTNVNAIHSFEPIPDVYEQLEDSMRAISKVSCHNIALGETAGVAPMQISKKTNSSSLLPMAELHKNQFPGTELARTIDVPVVPLDDYVTQKNLPIPDLIKIDVQGFEKNVLSGGRDTVQKAKYCVLEMSLQPLYEGSPLFDEIYRLMSDLGFRLIGLSSPLTGESGMQLQVDGFFENERL